MVEEALMLLLGMSLTLIVFAAALALVALPLGLLYLAIERIWERLWYGY